MNNGRGKENCMKRKIAIWICILSLLVSFTGCNTKESMKDKEQKEMGRYVEQEMNLPEFSPNEMRIGAICNAAGQLEYYTFGINETDGTYVVFCYTCMNDTYEKKQVDWASEAVNTNGSLPTQIILGQDDNYYMLSEIFESENIGKDQETYSIYSYLYGLDAEGKKYVNLTPESWGDKEKEEIEKVYHGKIISDPQVSKDGILSYKENDEQVFFYDLDKKKTVDLIPIETEQRYIIKDNTIYYLPVGESFIHSYDFETKKEEKYQISTINGPINIQVSDGGNIYLLDRLGIHCYKKGSTMWETLVDGSISSMGIPSYGVTSFNVSNGEYETFYVLYHSRSESGKVSFAQYIYDETIEATFSKELTVYSLWDNISIRESISNYMKKHTDTKIEYVVANSDDSSVTVSDQIRALNTELLSQKGADIIVLDGLPMESYIQSGVLVDTNDIFSELYKSGSLVKNIADNYMKDGKVYGMPIRFLAPIYYFSEDIAKETLSTSALAQLSMNHEKEKLFEVHSYNQLLTMFLYTYYDEFTGVDGLIDETPLRNFLTNIKTLAENTGAIAEQNEINDIVVINGMGGNKRIQSIFSDNALQLLSSNVSAAMGYISDTKDLQFNDACIKQVNGYYGSVSDKFIPNGIVGINKATKDINLAKDFVKSLYEEEIQSKHFIDGFPMNSFALDKWMNEPEDKDLTLGFSIIDKEGKVIMINGKDLSVEERKGYYSMLLSLTKAVNNDTIVLDIIVEAGLSYLRGEKSLDEVVQATTEKVNLYLSE